MKTTFDIPESLLREVQRIAKVRRVTAKSVVEQALRDLIAADSTPVSYELPDRSVPGDGLQPEFRGASWAKIQDAAYGVER